MSTSSLGYLFALADMATYGLLPVATHYLVTTMDPLLFGGVATLVGSIPLLVLLKKQQKLGIMFSEKNRASFLLISAILTCASITFFIGTTLTSGINTGLLLQVEPVYAVILGILFLKESTNVFQLAATLIMLAGSMVIVYRGPTPLNPGDFLIFVTPLFNQIAHAITKRIMNKQIDGLIISTVRLFYGGIMLTLISVILHPNALQELTNPWILGSILGFGIIFRTLDVTLWYQAIQRIPLSKASAVLPIAAAISFLGSIVLLKESPTTQQFLGLLFIAGGLLWFSLLHLQKSVKKRTTIL